LGVSTSGFYDWCDRMPSDRVLEDQDLLKHITKIYWDSEGRYGSPRVFKALKKRGFNIGRKRVERLMKSAGLVARCVKVCRRMPKLKNFQKDGENLLLEMSQPKGCDEVWVGDITYLKLNGKWQYLATIMDMYSRRILAWSLSTDRKTSLTIKVLRSAIKKRGIKPGLIFHSDRGIEYLGYDFRDELKRHDIRQSFNRAGHCTDNAFMESFFHTLKGELIRQSVYKTAKALRQALARYINGFYNRVRLHSSLDYMSPMEYEQRIA
jgi:putative transposase